MSFESVLNNHVSRSISTQLRIEKQTNLASIAIRLKWGFSICRKGLIPNLTSHVHTCYVLGRLMRIVSKRLDELKQIWERDYASRAGSKDLVVMELDACLE
jgi:hypothetical protein